VKNAVEIRVDIECNSKAGVVFETEGRGSEVEKAPETWDSHRSPGVLRVGKQRNKTPPGKAR
jgi:hypothetical protein